MSLEAQRRGAAVRVMGHRWVGVGEWAGPLV